VVEFLSGVSVQRGSVQPPGALNPADTDVPLAAVNLSKSFPLISYRTNGSTYDGGDFVRAKLTSTTNLRLLINDADTNAWVEWQVVEYIDASVQTGDVFFNSGDGSLTATLSPSLVPGKSWLIYTYQETGGGTPSDIGEKLVGGLVTDATTLTFDRNNTGASLDLTWYLVEFTDGTIVRHASEGFSSADTQRNVALSPPIAASESIAVGGYFGRGGRSPTMSTTIPASAGSRST
jgi:hypothetical protein